MVLNCYVDGASPSKSSRSLRVSVSAPNETCRQTKLKVEDAGWHSNLVSVVTETFTRWARSSFRIFYPFICALSLSLSLFSPLATPSSPLAVDSNRKKCEQSRCSILRFTLGRPPCTFVCIARYFAASVLPHIPNVISSLHCTTDAISMLCCGFFLYFLQSHRAKKN
jgi:hypothetical protein